MDDDNCPYCGPKKLVQFINKTTFFPLTYKTIAAGRARGSPSSRKIKKNKTNTFSRHPHEKQAMESYQFWEVADVFLLYSPSPSSIFSPPESIKQSSNQHCPLSLVSSQQSPSPPPAQFALHPRSPPTSLTMSPPVLPPPLPGEDEGRSSLGLRLQGQHPFALATLLLVGGPVPLLALGATIARHLAATADVELPELWKDKEQDHLRLWDCLSNALIL